MGQSTKTMLSQITAKQFGVRPDEINVVAGDTAYVSMGHGGFASRQTVTAGTSAHVAAKSVREKTLALAAAILNVSPERLSLRGGRVTVSDSNLSIGLGDLAREAIGVPGYALPKSIEPGLEQLPTSCRLDWLIPTRDDFDSLGDSQISCKMIQGGKRRVVCHGDCACGADGLFKQGTS
jgi:hypothetical protein